MRVSKRPIFKSLLPILGLSLSLSVNAADSRGIVRAEDGQEVLRYGKSYALLVGVSDYGWGSGWKDLDSIPRELDRVAEALDVAGFEKIERVDDPDDDRLHDAFEDFKDEYGLDENNRLLFFFAGHGYTDTDGKGYLVPRDAPNPRRDRKGFFRKALAMSQIMAWARQIKARHALFLFDSCFSGSVFRERNLPEEPPYITKLIARPVRQFITAGGANQPVPARSTFAPAFADAIRYSKGDLNKDGYVTGTELGLHLEAEVSKYKKQTPQFGKIHEYDLAQGDFVFVLGSGELKPKPKPRTVMAKKAENSGMEMRFWDSVEKSNDPKLYRAYLAQFPNGTFAAIAKIQVEKLESSVGWAKSPGDVPISRLQTGPQAGLQTKSQTGLQTGSEMGTAQGAFAHPTATTHAFTVRPDPADARVRILNIKPRYRPGMALKPGRYHVEVSKAGYERMRQWVDVEKAMILLIALKKLAARQAGDKWSDPVTGMEFVWVPKGCFRMGSNDGDSEEKPVHEVCVDGFWLGKTEVTQRQWRTVMGDNPSHFKGDNRPVETVSWNDTQEFIRKLNTRSQSRYRLATEAEWEYACRSGGKIQKYCGGDNLDSVGWYNRNSANRTHPVAQKSPNGLGLYDMSGNVWEWVQDKYDSDYYANAPRNNPQGPSSGALRVLRGGSWLTYSSFVRAAIREAHKSGNSRYIRGFRCVRVQP
uniref:Formylglycine-generating enzyme, required for sulfatase activity, contains SUMF1/FGE domain n=1 Tax=Candidatus Kentrum sp. TUN TaxID=2126343 RepID=A0A451A9C2_9GAMM|nr:MAG: Formylglycine-generating enzyme, required for sulfatase activity, contains SUMF1/FGE domain [Candidatus Kentron sp. TUN]VFK62632.1 MAG: Formylglycine-generating enzyme, required for sulfatase activity, contains SUMF1/FGE domain [Candidatus Kentron sp. TUN]